MIGLFVTGTDTGVGKTYASMGLIKSWRQKGLRVGVIKPSETGCEVKGEWVGPQDAKMLLEAAGSGQSLDEVCPYQYANPPGASRSCSYGR